VTVKPKGTDRRASMKFTRRQPSPASQQLRDARIKQLGDALGQMFRDSLERAA